MDQMDAVVKCVHDSLRRILKEKFEYLNNFYKQINVLFLQVLDECSTLLAYR